MADLNIDLGALSMTEIIRLQNLLSHELTRRFERSMAVVFSDIVGSTPYFARFGDEVGRRLQQLHIDLISECLPVSNGRIVDTAGDGAFLVFPSPDTALSALIELQKAVSRENVNRPRDHQLQVRMGVHWGPVLTDGVAVTGESVNLCARVAASAHIGEIRLTREVFQELALSHRLKCTRVEHTELKGVTRQVELLVFEWRDRAQFPTMVRIEETRQELPLPSQDMISFGRLHEHEGTIANDIVLHLPDAERARRISRWHFEIRRFNDGYRLRPVSEGATEVDGKSVVRGQEAPVKPGTTVRVAGVMTLTFMSPPGAQMAADQDGTVRVTEEFQATKTAL
jgi:class 3 adenylate cyclase